MQITKEQAERLAALHRSIAEAHSEIAEIIGAVPVPQEAEPAAPPAPPADKPEPIRISVSGIDMSKMGMTKSGSSIAWETLINHPPFQMFMHESGFPNPADKDEVELAADFIIEQSKTKAELAFYAEYAKWFSNKGLWPNETPMGGVKE